MAETPGPWLRFSSPAGRWVLLAAVLGSGIVGIDATAVNVALPSIGQDVGASLASLQWVVNAYTLTLAAFILLGGTLGDRYGRRRLFMVGVAWFAAASFLCGLAPTPGVLTAARALQGIGGALLTPGSLAMIQASFASEDRSRAIGAWSGLGGIATAVGPLLGGWLLQVASWRWVFWINLPVAVVVLALTWRHVPESRDVSATGRIDLLGAALGAVGLAGLTYASIEAPARGASLAVVGAAVIGVGALVAFVRVEQVTTAPMVPLSMFASPLFRGANLVTFFVYAAFGGIFFLLVLQLQVVVGFTPLAAGTAMLPVTVLMLLLSARAGALSDRIGPRLPMTVGPLACTAAVLLMLRIGPGASYLGDVLPAVLVLGLGLALLVAPLTATALAAVDAQHAGVASGVNNAVARAAGLLAVALLPSIAGLSGDDYTDPTAFAAGFRVAVLVSAALLAVAGITAALTIPKATRPTAQRAAGEQRPLHCAIDGPPSHVQAAPGRARGH